MERLDPKGYLRLRPLFARLRAHLVVDSMIEGNTPAWVFVARDAYELDLATAPEHRGRGLATAVAAACISECLTRRATPHWQCEEANPASMAVAEKVGFGQPARYIAYQFETA
jgi:GNAT superfamily N-acetyltransferase